MFAARRAVLAVLTVAVATSLVGGSAAAGGLPAPQRPMVPARAAAIGAPVNPSAAPHVPQLRHEGRWLVDQSGRVVILHGLNLVYKRAPYVAPATDRGFTARDARFMAAHGFNAVRLGVLFQGVMPRPGVIDHHYLARINRIVKLLAARHIWVLLDFHQDAFSQQFAGEGFPSWAVHDDGLPFKNLGSFFLDDQEPSVEAAFDHVWHNEDNLWRYYTKAWAAVAKKWRSQPYLMGYDLFNEPSAGTQNATCANPLGCPLFDALLERFYNHVRVAIRQVDPRNLVWFEPQFLFNAVSTSHFTKTGDPEVALSWHDYACTPAFVSGGVVPGDPDCVVNEPRVMNDAEQQMTRLGAGGMMTEFGAEDDLSDIARLTKYADQHLFGWMYWAYKEWNDPTGSANEGLFTNDAKLSSVKAAKLWVLVHPYPQAIAGVPTAMSWTPTTKVLTFSFRSRRSTGRTRIFVPRHEYSHGYTVTVHGGSARRSGSTSVLITAHRNVRVVDVTLRPHG